MKRQRDLQLTVYSDYVCPFCYLEMPVLDRLRAAYDGRLAVDWRPFELRPEPAPTLDPNGAYLHRVWADSVYPMAHRRGMDLRLPSVQPRSRKAMEAAEHARDAGRFEAMHAALFRAFFEAGRDIGEVAVLLEVAAAAGLDRAVLEAELRGGRHVGRVLDDQRRARNLGITGVPTILVEEAGEGGEILAAVSGAQPYEVLEATVERVLSAGR